MNIAAPAVLAAPVAAPLVSHAAVAAPVAYAHAPIAASSYSVSTQHVSPSVVSYASPLAVAHSYGVPAVSYATKSIAPIAYGQQYLSHW